MVFVIFPGKQVQGYTLTKFQLTYQHFITRPNTKHTKEPSKSLPQVVYEQPNFSFDSHTNTKYIHQHTYKPNQKPEVEETCRIQLFCGCCSSGRNLCRSFQWHPIGHVKEERKDPLCSYISQTVAWNSELQIFCTIRWPWGHTSAAPLQIL